MSDFVYNVLDLPRLDITSGNANLPQLISSIHHPKSRLMLL